MHGGSDESEAMRQLEEGTFIEVALHGVSVATPTPTPSPNPSPNTLTLARWRCMASQWLW